ncbi:hypothetical protein [Thermofilum pendens]|uniref:Uncharacterized protein n=1 Tax=Thermofilum pendens (strain DSM 2475 / Hrk 5) TaxID=368408 RepID=A1RZF8_THEPD|nr:hypothetical protein [Thermofilum pendens]ABL78588.1 hypothetical protein Tpen_1190 [Thermofilum pendens Hrk 5]
MALGRRLLSLIVVSCIVLSLRVASGGLTALWVTSTGFYNYDFKSQVVSSSNVDWPVTMVFYGNADVNKVKNIFFGLTILANPMYAYIYSNGWVWDTDRGTKGVVYSNYLNGYVYLHMRVYAPNPPDYIYDPAWGKYVIGTTHYDEYPLESWSGYPEYAEHDFAAIARSKGYTVYQDWAYFYNDQGSPGSITYNDGYATAVYVP